jgi:uncharacterized protein DUF3574
MFQRGAWERRFDQLQARLVVVLSLVMLAGCAESPGQLPSPLAAPYSCLLPGEERMLVAELFFGRNIKGRQPVTDAEWAEFAAQSVTPNFPNGFTVFDGAGQWRNPQTGTIARDPSKILLVAAKRESDPAQRLSAVIDAYKARFHQQSVGIITRDSCAAF